MRSSLTKGPMRVGGVDEVDTQVPPPGAGARMHSGSVAGLAPDAIAGEAHGSKAEAGNIEVAADGKPSGSGRVK